MNKNIDKKIPCHRCGYKNLKKDRYHSQFGFVALWYCKDRITCAKRQKKNEK